MKDITNIASHIFNGFGGNRSICASGGFGARVESGLGICA